MNWLIAALASSIAFGLNGVIGKYLLENDSDFTYTYLYSILALLFYIPVFIYFVLQTSLNLVPMVLGAALISGTLNILAYLAFDEAMKETDISEVVPLTRTQPVFVGILGALLLSETLNATNIGGIAAVTVGTYIVLRRKSDKLVTPLIKLKNSRAHQYALISALLWSSMAIIDRFATQQISPEIYTFMIYTVMVFGLSTNMLIDEKRKVKAVKTAFKRNKLMYILSGGIAAFASLMIFTAFSLAPASKVIPVLQLQVLISVIAGILMFNEEGSLQKLIGSIILLAGVFLIVQ